MGDQFVHNRPGASREAFAGQRSGSPGLRDLRPAQLVAVLEYAEHAAGITEAAAVPSMLEQLVQVVGADTSTLTRIDLRSGHEVAVLWPATRAQSAALADYPAAGRMHPLRPVLAQQARSGIHRPTPVRISDVLARARWRNSALFATSHRGVDDQMCVLTAVHRHTIELLVVSRFRGSFTDRQVAVFDGAGVHLAAAVHRIGQQLLPAMQVAPTLRRVMTSAAIPRRPGGPGVAAPTARQEQILTLVADGLTDAQIGRRLGVTAATVSKHLTRTYARLGVPNRAAAVGLIGHAPQIAGSQRVFGTQQEPDTQQRIRIPQVLRTRS
jgi:DNA-binding CsgD family transcriptional regulator